MPPGCTNLFEAPAPHWPWAQLAKEPHCAQPTAPLLWHPQGASRLSLGAPPHTRCLSPEGLPSALRRRGALACGGRAGSTCRVGQVHGCLLCVRCVPEHVGSRTAHGQVTCQCGLPFGSAGLFRVQEVLLDVLVSQVERARLTGWPAYLGPTGTLCQHLKVFCLGRSHLNPGPGLWRLIICIWNHCSS